MRRESLLSWRFFARFRSLAVLLMAAALMLSAPAQSRAAAAETIDPAVKTTYALAFEAARNQDWARAEDLARQGADALLNSIIEWMRLTTPNQGALFEEVAAFLEAHPGWEGDVGLRRRAEEGMALATSPSLILKWFETRRPLTTDGRMEYARALLAAGRADEAARLIRETWRQWDFGPQQERNFLARFAQYLNSDDDIARLDDLLWTSRYSAARRMLGRVDVGYRALAEARIKLARMQGGVDAAIDRVPAELRNDPGLLYERARWRRRKGFEDEALELLWKAPTESDQASQWWTERAYQSRRLLQKGFYSEAYRIAAAHGQEDGFSFAEGEWLAGWIALRFLKEPETALRHFNTLYLRVRYPVSLSRGAYWAGRAAEATGLEATAYEWYEKAAAFVATYYGQLAALRLPEQRRPRYLPLPDVEADRRISFEARELVRAARRLDAMGEHDLVRDVLLHIDATATDPVEQRLASELATELNRSDVAVRAARRAYNESYRLVAGGFPIVEVAPPGDMEKALIHAVIRQESGFIGDAISRAGARGLMQLMPATAKRTASKTGIPYSKARLLDDPNYNIRIGTAHLAELLNEFGGSYVLALAAYNAGEHRVRRWLVENGDPRTGSANLIDWVELIPFYETRDYVQRVLENLQVYRWRLNGIQVAALPYDEVYARSALAKD